MRTEVIERQLEREEIREKQIDKEKGNKTTRLYRYIARGLRIRKCVR